MTSSQPEVSLYPENSSQSKDTKILAWLGPVYRMSQTCYSLSDKAFKYTYNKF